MAVVYLIENQYNGKKYVGVTARTLNQRMYDHFRAKTVIGSALRHHGRDVFTITTVFSSPDAKDCYAREQEFIALHRSHVTEHGYNVAYGGEAPPTAGRKQSVEERQKRSERMRGNQHAKGGRSKLGKPVSAETRKKISETKKARAHVCTEDHRRKLSETSTGRVFTQESREKKSLSMKGKQNALGSKRSDETRRKMAEAAKARWAAKKKIRE